MRIPFLPRLCFAALALACTQAAFAQQAATAAPQATVTPEQAAPWLKPGQPVRIAGGRTLNLVCLGTGAPTVLLAPPLGAWSLVWWQVQLPLSQKTRVCAWDPAGTGFSSPSPEPQDLVHVTADLEQALQAAGIHGPYVAVGHSIGGYIALRFADRHRSAMAGMVLVDPSIPDMDAVMDRVAPKLSQMNLAPLTRAARQLRDCAEGVRNGTLQPGTSAFRPCSNDDDVDGFPPAFAPLKAPLARLDADPARLLTQVSMIENIHASETQVVDPQRNYGDLPLIVLTAGSHDLPPSTPADVREQSDRFFHDTWLAGHNAYAALSTRGISRLVRDSSHYIELDRPEVVVAAIEEVMAKTPARPATSAHKKVVSAP